MQQQGGAGVWKGPSLQAVGEVLVLGARKQDCRARYINKGLLKTYWHQLKPLRGLWIGSLPFSFPSLQWKPLGRRMTYLKCSHWGILVKHLTLHLKEWHNHGLYLFSQWAEANLHSYILRNQVRGVLQPRLHGLMAGVGLEGQSCIVDAALALCMRFGKTHPISAPLGVFCHMHTMIGPHPCKGHWDPLLKGAIKSPHAVTNPYPSKS